MDMAHLVLAEQEFSRAKARARRSRLLSLIKGERDDLLSFQEVKKVTRTDGESYIGCRSVPVRQIVGSEDRIADFNKSFCPRKGFMQHRWVRVDSAFYDDIILPPVKLFELGGVYFVRDGHHRISIARAHGVDYIDAEVTRVDTKITLNPKMGIRDMQEQVLSVENGIAAA